MFDGFSIIAHSTVTNTGPSVVAGEVGTNGPSITGFPPGKAASLQCANAVAADAMTVAQAEFDLIDIAKASALDLTGMNLGNMTLKPGAYRFSSSAELTGVLTLKGPGRFTFFIASTLTTASGAKVELIDDCQVTWAVGSSATLGTGTEFAGDIIADASITVTTGCTVAGSLAALNGAVTLDSAKVT